jgi:ubiquinone/menaquinone biosynthesis C-methylase UbiE
MINISNFSKKLRIKRFKIFFNKIIDLPKPIKILDLGGTYMFWEDVNFISKLSDEFNIKVTLLNLTKENVQHESFSSVKGDATDLSMFSDNEFDIIFSNSLIEHLYPFSNQEKMAKEAMRVGNKYFIQTPNRYFPIEPHYFFPFFQFLPYGLKKLLMMKTTLIEGVHHDEKSVWRAHNAIRLLNKKEFKKLFNDGKIFKENLFGLTKSYMITNL